MQQKKYKIIYADPPWQFRVWSDQGKARSAERHYPTMNDQWLRGLDIPAICEQDCVLLMWATWPCLKSAIALGEAWGFTYKTVAFTWVKQNRKSESLFMGMGYYTRANTEAVLLFTKGKVLPRLSRSIMQVVMAPVARHSEKPAIIRERIVELFGNRPRVELFARDNGNGGQFNGWDLFGNEVGNSISINQKNVEYEN